MFLSYLSIFALTSMKTKKLIRNLMKTMPPLILGGGILYWMYRGFDFSSTEDVLLHQMNWTWMLLSLPFGVLAQTFRGWRWKQTLEPLGEKPRASVCVNSIFLSYAVSLVIPRIGEFARCGVLSRYEKVSFPKALGTVVTERAVDMIIILMMTGVAFLTQLSVFVSFFSRTGTRIDGLFERFTTTGWIVTAICGMASIALVCLVLRRLALYKKVKETLTSIWQGIISLGRLHNVPLFLFYSAAIWVSYFLHYFLTFYCLEATAHLGVACALVSFIVGSIAVIVPTPNGAGSWHFAVKTMLILYGVADVQALYFVLIVHTIQTLLVVLLGIYAWMSLGFTKARIWVGNVGQTEYMNQS